MHRIVIKHFGPVQSVELSVKDILIFIGPQASGKSTVSKAIYFFRSLRDDLLKYALEALESQEFNTSLDTYAIRVRKKFPEIWGPTQHLERMYLEYDYGNGVCIKINLRNRYIDPIFNDQFKEGFYQIVQEAQDFNEKSGKRNLKFLSSSEILAIEAERGVFFDRLEALTNALFNDKKDLIFIPAGRSLPATLSSQLQNINPHKLDYLTRAFLERIDHSKLLFSKGFSGLISDKKELTRDKIDFDTLAFARQIIENILKGRYRFDNEGEKLFFDSDRYTKLNFASSGQQESIWILLLIFLLILDNQDVFIVFEEPEAHLYPEAQKEIVELISLLTNLSQNQIIITTHSPYILSSFNNLLYAHILGQTKGEEVNSVVDRRIWTDPNRLGAFLITGGTISNIVDEDVALIKTEAIDDASETINNVYYQLFDLDDE